MPSLQFFLVSAVFRLRRAIKRPTSMVDVPKERAEIESLARYFKIRPDAVFTPVMLGGVPAEWAATPACSADGAILYFHGGSYNSGSISSHRSLVANIAHAAATRVLNVGYRLAPEHPFPAALEDAAAAYRWLLGNHFRPDKIIIAGDSAGGGLTLALLVHLRDAGEPIPAAAVCLSPWTDLSRSGESRKINAKKDIMLDPGYEAESARLYAGEADPRTPLVSPLYAELRGLPPVLIQVGSHELILSDSTCFAERARAAGVKVTLEVWPAMQHEWQFAANFIPEARQAIEHIGQFIQEQVRIDEPAIA